MTGGLGGAARSTQPFFSLGVRTNRTGRSGCVVTMPRGSTLPPPTRSTAEFPQQAGEDEHGLGEGEAGADADAGAGAEGHVGEAVRRRGAGEEAGGIEGVGVVPAAAVAVQHPRRDRDDGAGGRRGRPAISSAPMASRTIRKAGG